MEEVEGVGIVGKGGNVGEARGHGLVEGPLGEEEEEAWTGHSLPSKYR